MTLSPAARPPLRLFIGLWPDDEVRAALLEHQARWCWPRGASPVRSERLHLTTQFLGDIHPDRVDGLRAALRTLSVSPFELPWDTAECWSGGIAVVRPQSTSELVRWHADIGSAIAAVGFAPERRPFVPHVTLARRATGAFAPATLPDCRWIVDGAVLIASDLQPPARYVVIERFGGGGTG